MNRERIANLERDYLEDHPGTAGTVEPFVFNNPDEPKEGTFPFPIITDNLLSEDWEPADEFWFVDSSGFGQEGEPALTMEEFRAELMEYVQQHPDHGFGLSGVGQFQVYVSAYRRIQ